MNQNREKEARFTVEFLKGTAHFGKFAENIDPFIPEEIETFSDKNLNLITNNNPEKSASDSDKEISVSDSDQTTLLLVEDHLDMREYVKSILVQDYKIMEAENGEEALEIIKNPS